MTTLQITTNTVEHALGMLGVHYHSHKDYFSALLSSSTSPPSDAESDDTNESSPAKPTEGSTCEQEDPTTPALPANRNIYTPLVRPPSALGIHPLDCFSQMYMWEALWRADRRVEQGEDEEASLMSDETDEEALDAELQGDEALDSPKTCIARTRSYPPTRDLWNQLEAQMPKEPAGRPPH